jgi:rSAM/selenodomain-associated transferase 1
VPPATPETTADRRLLLFTKPARAGRVKTRLIGDLTPVQAAELHAAFVADLVARLTGASCDLHLAWALEPGEELSGEELSGEELPGAGIAGMPDLPDLPSRRQEGADLGERLYAALADAAREARVVAALGSDHPSLPVELVERAFAAIEAGTRVVLGPAEDGGYYLIALAAPVPRRLFEEIDWSTGRVLAQTLARCAELGITPELLPVASDVDTPEDLARLARRMAGSDLGCPRTRRLLADWGRLSPDFHDLTLEVAR